MKYFLTFVVLLLCGGVPFFMQSRSQASKDREAINSVQTAIEHDPEFLQTLFHLNALPEDVNNTGVPLIKEVTLSSTKVTGTDDSKTIETDVKVIALDTLFTTTSSTVPALKEATGHFSFFVNRTDWPAPISFLPKGHRLQVTRLR